MKNKSLIIAVIVILVVILGAGGFYFLSQSKTAGTSMMENGQSALDDIFASNVSMECNYDDPEYGQVTAYIKGGKVRMNYVDTQGGTGSSIIKDDTMYFWNEEGGFKMEMAREDMEAMQEEAQESTTQNDASEIAKSIEEYKEHCKNASVSDSNFDLPVGVEFQDYSSMMPSSEQMQQMMHEQSATQEDAPQDSMPSQEDIQKMMEQYGAQE